MKPLFAWWLLEKSVVATLAAVYHYIHAPWWTGMNILVRADYSFKVCWQGTPKPLVGLVDLFHVQEVPRHSGLLSWHIAYSLLTKPHSNWSLSSGEVMSILPRGWWWRLWTEDKPVLHSAFVHVWWNHFPGNSLLLAAN